MTNEQALIASVLDKDLAEVPESILPMTSKLQLAVQKAFLENLQGPNIDALRRCVNALKNGSPYRGTVAYEALAKFQAQEPDVVNSSDYKDPPLNFHTADIMYGPATTRETLTGKSNEGPWEHATIQSKAFPDVYVNIHVIKDGGISLWTCGFRRTSSDKSGYTTRESAVVNAIGVVKSEVRARLDLMDRLDRRDRESTIARLANSGFPQES